MSYVDAEGRITDISVKLEGNNDNEKEISPDSHTMLLIRVLVRQVYELKDKGEDELANAADKIKRNLNELEKKLLKYKGNYGGKAIEIEIDGEGTMMNWVNDLRREIDEIIAYHNEDVTDQKKINFSMFSNTPTPDNGNTPSQGSGA